MRRLRVTIACAAAVSVGLFGCADDSGSAGTDDPPRTNEAGTLGTAEAALAPSRAPTSAHDDAPREPSPGARSSAAANPAGWPPVEFEPGVLDFGVMAPGQTETRVTRIWNVGDTPLEITAARTSCGCSSLEDLSGRRIAPGESTTFATTLTPKSGLGEKKEAIRIKFASHETLVQFDFRAEVSLPVRATPPHLTALETISGVVELEARDGRPFRVLAAGGRAPVYEDGSTPSAAQLAHRIVWDLSALDARDAVPWFWVVETDHPDAPVVDLRVRHLSTRPQRVPGRPWVQKDQRVIVGRVGPGESSRITTKLEYSAGATPEPRNAKITMRSDGLLIEGASAERDGQFLVFTLDVTPITESGLFYEEVELTASGHSTIVRVIGRVDPSAPPKSSG